MDSPRSTSRSRRSYPNLHNLSLAPLSSKYSPPNFDTSASPMHSPSEGTTHLPRTSYIAQKSAPTTPGILSRSSSRNGRHRRPKGTYAYDGYFRTPDTPFRDVGDIRKANSTSTMHGVSFADQPDLRHHERKRTAPLNLHSPSLTRSHTKEGNDEWLYRAGLAIAGETRDSKGQGWLVRRESSTSIVGQTDDYEQHASHNDRHIALSSGEHFADYSAAGSRIHSRRASRVPSRAASARNSRRGSRAGSRVDLLMSAGARTPNGNGNSRNSFEFDDSMFDSEDIGPDFVSNSEDDSEADEEEVARLARERGFGLGGWMDRLIGWTLFSVDEDGEESDEEDGYDEYEEDGSAKSVKSIKSFNSENMTKEEAKLRREVEAKRKKMEREAIIAASAVRSDEQRYGEGGVENLQRAPDEEGGWADAAWLFSVATKVIL